MPSAAVFIGPQHQRGAQALACGGAQVVFVRGHHHHLRGLQAKYRGRPEIDLGFGFVVLKNLG